MENKKRFAVKVDLYMYATTDAEAKEIAKTMARMIDICGEIESQDWDKDEFLKQHHDNKCSVVSIHEAPFGQIGNAREIR